MALVVFMRGVNVGGKKTFQPSVLARELEHLGALNLGAAGTFVIRSRCAQATLRAEFLRRLSFPAELLICRGRDIIELVASDPFSLPPVAGDVRRFVSILAKGPRATPQLPLDVPADGAWQVSSSASRNGSRWAGGGGWAAPSSIPAAWWRRASA